MDFPGDKDNDTSHFGLIVDNCLRGIASIYKEDYPGSRKNDTYRLRGMAIDNGLRGKGYGKLLLEEVEESLRKKDARYLWCNARIHATGFYERMGFKIKGRPFDIPGIGEHYLMIHAIRFYL